jgi:NAD+ kinase
MSEPTRGLAVLGDGDPAAAIRSAATAAGARLVDRPAADAVVAVGDAALREAMRAAASDARPAPILPVGGGRHAVDLDRATERVAAAVDGLDDASDAVEGFSRVGHPLLAVDAGDGERRVAVADVAFVTAAPARISEFEIALDGYAAAAGGPVVSPGGGLAVVPVSPFTTRPDTWVVSGGVRVTVEREEEPVALVVDGTRRGTVEPHRAVAVEVAARVDLLAPTAE